MQTIWLIVRVRPYEQVGIGVSPARILVLGDSTGYGTGATRGFESIEGLIGQDFPVYHISNVSKNGRTIGEALATLTELPPTRSYDLILFQLGGNDILQKRPLSVVERELRELCAGAKKMSKHFMMLSCGNVGTAARFAGTSEAILYDSLTRQFRSMFIRVVAESGGVYIDVFKEPAVDVFALEPRKYLSLDGLHPSTAGYAVWYSSLGPVVREVLLSQER